MNKKFDLYYLISSLSIILASFYPLSMGIKVIADMIKNGHVMKEEYPKYIIPYTPIALALIIGVLIIPVFIKLLKKYSFIGGAITAIAVFFIIEMIFENNVVVTDAVKKYQLEDWQMYMCAFPPVYYYNEARPYTPIQILMGEYNPAFKLHFYVISIVLILTILNVFYGFAQVIKNDEKERIKSLILQAISSFIFLALCILACFTAFFRDGNITVSPISAVLMSIFFILLGLTFSMFIGSYLIGKSKFISIGIPAIVSGVMTILMYVGEMILLNGNLYKFGTGFIFEPLPLIVLAPIDIFIIMISIITTAVIFIFLNKKESAK